MLVASGDSELAHATSFIQVEYGKADLLALWDAFVHTSHEFDINYKSKKHICSEFALALNAYIEDEESASYQVGL